MLEKKNIFKNRVSARRWLDNMVLICTMRGDKVKSSIERISSGDWLGTVTPDRTASIYSPIIDPLTQILDKL